MHLMLVVYSAKSNPELIPTLRCLGPFIVQRVAKAKQVLPAQCALKPRRVLRGHFGKVYAISWSSDSHRLCSAAQDGKLMLWNCPAGVKIFVIPLRSTWVMSCGYSPNGAMVASGGLDNAITVYKLPDSMALGNVKTELKETGDAHVTAELNGHEGYIAFTRFIGNTQMLSASGDSTCALFDIETQYMKSVFKSHTQDVMALSMIDADPNVFVSCSVDTTARLWDIRLGTKAIKTFTGHESDINSICMMGTGQSFVTGSDDTTCRLFDIRAYQQLSVYHSPKLLCGVTSVALSTTSKLLFAGYDLQDFWVWDLQLGNAAQVVEKSHGNRISCLAVSPNGHGLATGSWDYLIKIWA